MESADGRCLCRPDVGDACAFCSNGPIWRQPACAGPAQLCAADRNCDTSVKACHARCADASARSLYAAFLLFLLRYYGLPVLNNYPVDGLANLPFEDHLAAGLSALARLISGAGS
ncbi:MAG: hypothetical protein CM15mP100_1450 [Alphaproteobacteria bacterium]|nr:MAG: hypothetical protein CM15mP100_1450 [Alphaproteobacteria bacterium]